MGLHGDALLREARDTIKTIPEQSAKSDDGVPTNLNNLADAVEKEIKAALIESHGSLPAKHDDQKLC
jgi:hypothetical protein